ncbi:hypothetical protein BH10BAC6_BH10BAC6_17920 [soil metagenome]
MSKKSLREKLQAVPPDILAELIERYAKKNPALKQEMLRLLSDEADMASEVKKQIKRLSALTRNTRLQSKDLHTALENMLTLITDIGIRKPDDAMMLLCSMLANTSVVLTIFEDSSFRLRSIYEQQIPECAATLIPRCTSEDQLLASLQSALLEELRRTRYHFLFQVGQYLSDRVVAAILAFLAALPEKPHPIYGSRLSDHDEMQKALLLSIGDTAGFERVAGRHGPIEPRDVLALAQMFIDHEEFEKAEQWLDTIPDATGYVHPSSNESIRDLLYMRIAERSGNVEKAISRLHTRFLSAPSREVLESLQTIAPQQTVDGILEELLAQTQMSASPSANAVRFLIQHGFAEQMEELVMQHHFDEDFRFDDWPLVAVAFIHSGMRLAASVIYRILIDDILTNARTTAYHYAASYFRTLSRLSTPDLDWRGIDDHNAYTARLWNTHRLKTSFWASAR